MPDFDTIISSTELALGNLRHMLAYDPQAPMLFSSGLFWLLFILILPIYVALKSSKPKMVVFIV
ncbi:MAG: hypothetical protein K2F87_02705, partial [Muribaculaceae bacterium]|nr:hypothetical protein [Muribaculaceae bacterium]